VTNVHYLAAGLLDDPDPGARARGRHSLPQDLGIVHEILVDVVRGGRRAAVEEMVAFLVADGRSDARSVLVAGLGVQHRDQDVIRSAIADIDVRRHEPDPRLVVPQLEPWAEVAAPDGYAELVYDVLGRHIGRLRRSIQISRSNAEAFGTTLDDAPEGWLRQTEREIAALEAITMADCRQVALALEGRGVVDRRIRRLAETVYPKQLSVFLTPLQRLRLVAERPDHNSPLLWDFDYEGVDLRLFVDALTRLGDAHARARVSRTYFSPRFSYLLPTLAWPLYATYPGTLDDCLGLAAPEVPIDPLELARALGVLVQMPVLPRRYEPRVRELAIEGASRPRAAARAVVEKHMDRVDVALAGLRHGRAPIRSSAALWLSDVRVPAVESALRAALAREGSAGARAAMEDALVRHDREPMRRRPPDQ
jgi:hypothetical protein